MQALPLEAPPLVIRYLQRQDYQATWHAMKTFTDQRTEQTFDELWVVEHPPVFTQGQAGKAEHILHTSQIPIIQTDRGGQVTYHGPGQIVIYTLINLKRLKIGIRDLVTAIENAVVALLAEYQITAYPKADAPGVYVNHAKICSLGLRVRKGCSFHGLALNVEMDLTPFSFINPCGYNGLQMTQMSELTASPIRISIIQDQLTHYLAQQLGYNTRVFNSDLTDIAL